MSYLPLTELGENAAIKCQTNYSPNPGIQATIEFLLALGCPALPVLPKQDPRRDGCHHQHFVIESFKRINEHQPEIQGDYCRISQTKVGDATAAVRGDYCRLDEKLQPIGRFTGKNPSYLDRNGRARSLNHGTYQERLPTEQELREWFANPAIGVGTLGGHAGVDWLDFDSKNYPNQEECDQDIQRLIADNGLEDSWIEKTGSGGWRIAVRPQEKPSFTNFATEQDGVLVGEALFEGRFTVLAPSIHPNGNSYRRIGWGEPAVVESLESIGIYPTKDEIANQSRKQKRGKDGRIQSAPTDPTGNPWDIRNFADRLVGYRIEGEWINCKCPAHNGASDNSLHIRIDTGAYKCWAGCDNKRISQEALAIAISSGYELPNTNEGVINEPKQTSWKCLPTNNCQIGYWSVKEFSIDKHPEQIERLQAQSQDDPNVIFSGLKKTEKGEVATFRIFVPKCDFNFECDKLLSDSEGGGLMLRVQRVEGRKLINKVVYIKSAETTRVSDFTNAIKREFGRNLSITLKPEELQALLQNRTAHYHGNGGKTFRLADRTGQQDDGTWVFEDCQFRADGTPTSEKDSLWIFNRQLGETEKIPSPKISPQNPEALKQLATAAKGFFHPEILPKVWFTCGYATATLQRQTIMKKEKCFPQLNLFGDPGGAKTTAAKVAVSLTGMHEDRSVISRFTESLIYEQVKSLGGLPLLIDDPIKKGMKRESRDAIDNFLWAMYNGTTRKVRGNEQTPHTSVITTSNVALGEGNQATESRLLKINFPVLSPNELGFPALEEAMSEASGGLSQLLAIQYDRDAVKDIRSRLLEFLPTAHARISSSLALVTYFTQRFTDACGISFDAIEYCKKHLCPQANDFESDKDSLTDFLEKLSQMRSEGATGEWNVTSVRSGHKKYLAVDLASVWYEFDRRFNPNYSRQSLTALIQDKCGKTNIPQRFVATKLEWNEFLKAQAAYERLSPHEKNSTVEPAKPKKTAQRKCVLIPESLLSEDSNEEILNGNFSDYESEVDLIDSDSPINQTATRTAEQAAEPVNADDDDWAAMSSPAPANRPPDLPKWVQRNAIAHHVPTETAFRITKVKKTSDGFYNLVSGDKQKFPLAECSMGVA